MIYPYFHGQQNKKIEAIFHEMPEYNSVVDMGNDPVIWSKPK